MVGRANKEVDGLAETIGTTKHAISSPPANVALKGDIQRNLDATFSLKAFEVCNAVAGRLDFDGECSNCRNDIEGVAEDVVARKSRVELPNCSRCFDRADVGDDRHEIGDGEVDNVGQAGETVYITVEGINVFAMEDALDAIACSVVVAGIIGRKTKQL